jgi:hypothetical protein
VIVEYDPYEHKQNAQQQQQNPKDRGTTLALVQLACSKTPQDEQMIWPAGFNGQGLSSGGA